MAVSWRISLFQKCLAETPMFIVFLGARLFRSSCQKREFLDTHQKRKMTDNWKAFWGILVVFFFPFFLFCLFFAFFCYCFLGFKGQMRWPEGPPHLALNPPFVICLFFWFSFSFFAFNKKTCFAPTKRLFFFFCVSLCFSIAFFGLPLFQVLFLCLSLVLSFLPSCLSFLLSFGSLKEQHQK